MLEDGGTKAKVAFPNVFCGTEKLVRMGDIRFTVKDAVIVPDEKLAVLACVAVMVVVPPPTMVTILPSIVATVESELV